MKGETVVIEKRTDTGVSDPYGKPLYRNDTVAVGDVLVSPGATDDVIDSNRPDGVSVAFTLYFPKTFDADLTGANIRVRGEKFGVVGSPRPYAVETTPTRWNMKVEVVRVDG